MRIVCWVITVLLTLGAVPGAAEPVPRGGATTLPATRRAAGEYRFDALRIDGAVRGPLALRIQGTAGGKHSPLLRLQRSFVSRIFETVEAPALHGGH